MEVIVVYQKRRARVYKGSEAVDYDYWSYRVIPISDCSDDYSEGIISYWLVPNTEDS